MLAVALVCIWHATPHVPLLFVTAAGLMLSLSVLQDTYNMAFRDDLTGLQSRRALNEQLMGLGRRYVVAMVDVDHFKRFNDTYGHDVGDQVLNMVAGKIDGVKGGGKAFRYGGEEFTVIFSRKKAADIMHHLEELRKTIAGYELWLRSQDRPKKSSEGKTGVPAERRCIGIGNSQYRCSRKQRRGYTVRCHTLSRPGALSGEAQGS